MTVHARPGGHPGVLVYWAETMADRSGLGPLGDSFRRCRPLPGHAEPARITVRRVSCGDVRLIRLRNVKGEDERAITR